MKRPLRAPTTRGGWAAYYDVRARGGNVHACTLSNWYLLLVDAFAGRRNDAELEVELDQAWMAPAFRKRRWGETAAIAIAFATERHVKHIRATTRWPREFYSKLQLTVGADLYSHSGEALLAKCAEYVSFQFSFEPEPQRLSVPQIILDGRW